MIVGARDLPSTALAQATLNTNGVAVAGLAIVPIPALRVARCGECGVQPGHPLTRACSSTMCPVRHAGRSA